MKNSLQFIVLLLAFVSCKQNITDNDLENINGYWEIENVILPDGTIKEYKINETIDYFEVKNNVGFRKKVKPQFNGTYLVNDVSENIKIISKDNKKMIQYSTNLSKWNEEIIALTSEELVLKNDQNLEYHYKKPIPFSIK